MLITKMSLIDLHCLISETPCKHLRGLIKDLQPRHS